MKILMNMFNNIDPMIFNLPINWMFSLNSLILLFNLKWINKNFFKNILNNFIKEIFYMNTYINKNHLMIFLTIIMFIFFNNLLNIIPFNFSLSNNISFTIFFSIIMISSMNLFLLKFNKTIFFMNFTPNNTPKFIILIINIIELNSILIQIITLSMRLMINMMLSHMIMYIINMMTMIYILMIMEIFIIIIQSYVFYILNLIYSNNMF